MKLLSELLGHPKDMDTTTKLETASVKVQKIHILGNQQPSSFNGEGSTIISQESKAKRSEALSPLNKGEDMISSLLKNRATLKGEVRLADSLKDNAFIRMNLERSTSLCAVTHNSKPRELLGSPKDVIIGQSATKPNEMDMKTRECKKCKSTKQIEEFPISDSTKGYRRHICASCYSEWKKYHYNKNYDEIRAKQNARAKAAYNLNVENKKKKNAAWQVLYREKFRQLVFEAYGNKCVCCGEAIHQFLTIDHKNNDGWTARKNRQHPLDTLGFHRWLVRNNFPDSFQLLCMNCNFGKARNGGACPHTQKEGSSTISKESTAKRLEVRGVLQIVKKDRDIVRSVG